MKIDITLKITPKMVTDAQCNEKKALVGHLGTHFDVMNKEFPLEYTERKGIVFDVSEIKDRDVNIAAACITSYNSTRRINTISMTHSQKGKCCCNVYQLSKVKCRLRKEIGRAHV